MAIDVKLPELGEGVTEGELVKWLVKVGDSVKTDQPVAEIMTDKATVEVPSNVSGVVKELKYKIGDVIPVEKVILTLEASAGAAATTATHAAQAPAAASTATSTSATASSATGTTKSAPAASTTMAMSTHGAGATASATGIYPPVAESRVLATPATRRLAREMGVDINQVSGSGLAGRVTRDDVTGAGSGSGATQSSNGAGKMMTKGIPTPSYNGGAMANAEERVAMRGIRKKIAENMQMSKSIIPHFTLMDECDVSELVALRESLKDTAEKAGTKITYLPFVMKALIATVREFPMFNASIDDAASEIVYKKYFNIGFAADTPNGLVVPVIKHADHKTVLELSREILDLSKRARDGKLKPDEMKGATITITNIGSVGGTYATPIINHPEVAILGMYKIMDRPVILEGELAVAKYMNFTITADHRLIDGAVAANFLRAFTQRLSSPGKLMLDMI